MERLPCPFLYLFFFSSSCSLLVASPHGLINIFIVWGVEVVLRLCQRHATVPFLICCSTRPWLRDIHGYLCSLIGEGNLNNHRNRHWILLMGVRLSLNSIPFSRVVMLIVPLLGNAFIIDLLLPALSFLNSIVLIRAPPLTVMPTISFQLFLLSDLAAQIDHEDQGDDPLDESDQKEKDRHYGVREPTLLALVVLG
mmetsp:Transcript_42740/g.41076  ORF Transcript_42740/g.41076 Transcript_42740/m.41076 type:complete len:196 (+) Transcript_42740:313-900(+)